MDEEYLEAVLDVVELVPAGRVMTYGTVAEVVADAFVASGGTPRGGPRQVGTVLARAGSGVPWWRVVNAAGRPAPGETDRALARLRAEGTPLTADGRRVAVRAALWWPDDDAAPPGG
jgi:alkylated DNA nucleotide flippase Atl1